MTTPVTPEQVAEARRDLGRRLAARREAAGLTQAQLARLSGYTRSSIASLETGRSGQPRMSWSRYDQVLGAGGALLTAYDDYAALVGRQRQHAAEERERQRTAKIEMWQPVVPVVAPPGAVEQVTSLHRRSDRREFLAEGTRLAGVALSGHLADLFSSEAHEMHRALDSGSSGEALAYYEATADDMMICYERSGPGEVLAPALELYRTTCLLRLGQPDQVEAAAAEALRLYAHTPHYMDPTLIRLESATAHLLRQPPAIEQAAAEAQGALERLPVVHRTGPVRQRTAEIVAVLRGHPDVPAAREFVEYAAEL